MAPRLTVKGPAELTFIFEPSGETRRAQIGEGMTLLIDQKADPERENREPKVFEVTVTDSTRLRSG